MQPIPVTAAAFFQEYEFERLDSEQDADLVIERLLAYGNRDEIRWLLQRYGEARLRQWLSTGGRRRLPRRRYRMWCILLDVPESLREPSPLWPY
jgi:hypothetical protein